MAVIRRGLKPRPVRIGYLTDVQLNDINAYRLTRNWEPICSEIVFVGIHIYESRIVKDGYSEDDLIAQIKSALSATCKYIRTPKMTVLQNPTKMQTGYGCAVRAELTLECSARHPMSELFSVVLRGDKNHKPNELREAALAASLFEEVTNPPG